MLLKWYIIVDIYVVASDTTRCTSCVGVCAKNDTAITTK